MFIKLTILIKKVLIMLIISKKALFIILLRGMDLSHTFLKLKDELSKNI